MICFLISYRCILGLMITARTTWEFMFFGFIAAMFNYYNM